MTTTKSSGQMTNLKWKKFVLLGVLSAESPNITVLAWWGLRAALHHGGQDQRRNTCEREQGSSLSSLMKLEEGPRILSWELQSLSQELSPGHSEGIGPYLFKATLRTTLPTCGLLGDTLKKKKSYLTLSPCHLRWLRWPMGDQTFLFFLFTFFVCLCLFFKSEFLWFSV